MLWLIFFPLITNLFGGEPIFLPAPATFLSCEQLKQISPKTVMDEVTSAFQVQRECGGDVTFNDWSFSVKPGHSNFLQYRAPVKLCQFYSPSEDAYYFYDYYFTPKSNDPLVYYPAEYDLPPALQAIYPTMEVAGVISYPLMDIPKYKKKTSKSGVEVFRHSAFEQASRLGGDSYEANFRIEFNPQTAMMKVSGKAWDFSYPSPANYEVKCPPEFESTNKPGETTEIRTESIIDSRESEKDKTQLNVQPNQKTQPN